jgi:hypothetical protein
MTDRAYLDVAIVGAGPYGLSVAAHLAPKCRVRVFGRTMQTWRELMPPDMLLRSDWDHSNLSAPQGLGKLCHWTSETGESKLEPIPLQMFLRYADWFVERFVTDLDDARIERIERTGRGFTLETVDGRAVCAKNVVLAPGVTPFPNIPEVVRNLETDRVSLALEPSSLDAFRGQRVAVLGGGQNGLEAAARARRAGAESVNVILRSRARWFADREPSNSRRPIRERLYRLAYPIVGFGPPPLNRLVLHPELFARMPEAWRARVNARILRSGGSPWLRKELDSHVALLENASIMKCVPRADGLLLYLDSGQTLEVDRLIVACGFRFDIERMTVLSADLRASVMTRPKTGWPVLTGGLCTTYPGLYFVGYPTEGQFGPLARFIEGARFAAQRCEAALAPA